MLPLFGTHKDFTNSLKELIELDYDAVEAYHKAIEKIKDVESKELLTGFLHDHERHITELREILRKHNVMDCPTGPTTKQWLTKGKVVLGNLMGDDHILSAMSSNEDDTTKAYETIVNRNDKWTDIDEFLKKSWEDEKRHKHAIEERRRVLKEGSCSTTGTTPSSSQQTQATTPTH